MIRFVWVALVACVATAVYGIIAIGAALLRRRGGIYYWCTREWGRSILSASGARVVTHGMDRVDWSQPHVLVANHVSMYDIYALAAVLPVQFYFVGKKELNRIPLFGTAWRAAGHVSIDRSNRATAIASLKRAAERIRRERGVVIVFPEGTRSRTGELQSFKKGAFIMAADAGITIVPAVVRGSDRILRPGTFRVVPGTIEIRFADPVAPGDSATAGADAASQADAMLHEARSRMAAMMTEEPS